MVVDHNRMIIQIRRQKVWSLITQGMKGYEIARAINIDVATVSRDIRYLTANSQNYLNDLARRTLPFMYQTSIEGIREIMKECWNIYESTDNNLQKLAALRLAKDCNESIFKLIDEGPSVMYLKQLNEKLSQIENR